jgi:hypothetical protein
MTSHIGQLARIAGATAVLYGARRYFRNWGTTKDECQMHLPGDELIRPPSVQSTEGVWIDRSAADVWPWLVQMGQDRGGLYSYEILENSFGLYHCNADRIHPEWQRLEPGDVVRFAPRDWLARREGVSLSVVQVIDGQAIVLRGKPPGLPWETVWSFHLLEDLDDRCRLLVRTRLALRHPGEVVLSELAGPVTALMTRGMLRGIRRRAEAGSVAESASSTTAPATQGTAAATAGVRPAP